MVPSSSSSLPRLPIGILQAASLPAPCCLQKPKSSGRSRRSASAARPHSADFRTASAIFSTSSRVVAGGLSPMTCFPARAAATVGPQCAKSGVTTATASISGSRHHFRGSRCRFSLRRKQRQPHRLGLCQGRRGQLAGWRGGSSTLRHGPCPTTLSREFQI